MCSCDRSKSGNEPNSVKNSGQVSKNGGGNNSIDETLDEDKSNSGNNGQKNHSGSDNTSNDGNNGSNNGPDEKNKQKPEIDKNAKNIEGRFYKGIINVGNTCYMNSILQQIWAIPELVNVISGIDTENATFDNDDLKNDIIGLQAFFRLMGNNKKISTEEMKKVATNLGGGDGKQKDALELMGRLLDVSNSDLVKIHVKQITRCVDCNDESNSIVPENILNCDINYKTLELCLKNDFFKEDIVSSVDCSKCNAKKDKRKYNKIVKSPEVLLIQLKRFVFKGFDTNNDAIYNKNDKKVTFPEVLKLEKGWFDQNHKTGDESYDLSGIVMHNGGTGSGHYFSYCKLADNNWYQFNDSSFSEVNDPKAMLNEAYGNGKSSLSAYLLVYKKKK